METKRPRCKCGKPATKRRINIASPRAQARDENEWIEAWVFVEHARDCPRKRAERQAWRRLA